MLVLSTNEVTKSFGGLIAVNQFSFDIPEGKIYSVIGPNGAGKTTFFNCITGFYEFDGGKIEFLGQVLNGKSPDQITRLGISRTYQNIRLFSNMNAIENILVGHHPHFKTYWFEALIPTKRILREEAQALELFVNNEIEIWKLRNESAIQRGEELTDSLIAEEKDRLDELEEQRVAATDLSFENELLSRQEHELQLLQIQIMVILQIL